jgi:chromosome segregation ATPase
MKLCREVERLRAHQAEAETLRRELTRARARLEEERTVRGAIQTDLEQYQERVRVCMESMDGVERQFEERDLALAQLECERERGGELADRLRERLGQAEGVVAGQRRELERGVAAQKMLLQQVQEQEAEAGELQDFLQAEKGTLQVIFKNSQIQSF